MDLSEINTWKQDLLNGSLCKVIITFTQAMKNILGNSKHSNFTICTKRVITALADDSFAMQIP